MEKQGDDNESKSRQIFPAASRKSRSIGAHRRSIFGGGSLLPLTLVKPAHSEGNCEGTKRLKTPPELLGSTQMAKFRGVTAAAQLTAEDDLFPSTPHLTPFENSDQNDQYGHSQSTITHAVNQSIHPLLSRRRRMLRSEIEAYIRETYLSEVYGDRLSTHRTRLYEPQHPPLPPQGPGAPSEESKTREQASDILDQILAPLLPWYSLSSPQATTPLAQQRQLKVSQALDKHERERGARMCRQTICGSGQPFLYHNMPDRCRELSILTLINYAHMAIKQGQIDLAENKIARALGRVDALEYPPLNAKLWYWKGVIADKRGSPKEAAEAFIYAMEVVGKYIEGDYLPEFVKVYTEEMLDVLRVEDTKRPEWRRRLQRAAEGIEPLQLDSPRQLPSDLANGLNLSPPRELVPSPEQELDHDDQSLTSEGTISPTTSQEAVRVQRDKDMVGLGINISIPSGTTIPRSNSTTQHSPLSPHNPTSPLKPLPTQASPSHIHPQFSKEQIAEAYDLLSPGLRSVITKEGFTDGINHDRPGNAQTFADRVLQYTSQAMHEAREQHARALAYFGSAAGRSPDDREFFDSGYSSSPLLSSKTHIAPSSASRDPEPLSTPKPTTIDGFPPSPPSSHSNSSASPSPRISDRVKQIEFSTLVAKQTAQRLDALRRRQEEFPAQPLAMIREAVREAEMKELLERGFKEEVRFRETRMQLFGQERGLVTRVQMGIRIGGEGGIRSEMSGCGRAWGGGKSTWRKAGD